MWKFPKYRPAQLISAFSFVAGWYLAICAMAYFAQTDLLFLPLRAASSYPTGTGYFTETFYGSDGNAISAFWRDTGAPYAVLFFHGNGGNLGRTFPSLGSIESAGADFYAIDYRGYGVSSGHIEKETDLYADALSAYDRLVARWVPPEKIVVWGGSLWWTAAVKVAVSRKIAGLVIESSFASMDEMAEKRLPFLPTGLLNRFHFRSVDDVPKVAVPTLVIHSKDDEIVPIGQWRRLYEGLTSRKTFLEISGSHNGGHVENDGKIVEAFEEFLRKSVTKSAP